MPYYHITFEMTKPNNEDMFGFKATTRYAWYNNDPEAIEWFENTIKPMVFKWTQNGVLKLEQALDTGEPRVVRKIFI